MYQMHFQLGLCHAPFWGAHDAPPDPIVTGYPFSYPSLSVPLAPHSWGLRHLVLTNADEDSYYFTCPNVGSYEMAL